MTAFYRWQGDSLILYCHLQANAKRDKWVGEHGGRIKIRIAAAPVDGKANAHLRRFLSALFGVAPQSVSILQGELGKHKTIKIMQPKCWPGNIVAIKER